MNLSVIFRFICENNSDGRSTKYVIKNILRTLSNYNQNKFKPSAFRYVFFSSFESFCFFFNPSISVHYGQTKQPSKSVVGLRCTVKINKGEASCSTSANIIIRASMYTLHFTVYSITRCCNCIVMYTNV